MPTYEYECSGCGHKFERFQSMKDKRLRKCPKCGKMKLRRLVGSGGAVLFKGSGFYETDYKRASKPTEKSESSSETKSKGADSKSESSSDKSEASSGKADASSTQAKDSK